MENADDPFRHSRRSFLRQAATGIAVSALHGPGEMGKLSAAMHANAAPPKIPWYRTVTRWGQVNITEKDPPQYDIAWWRAYWKRTNIGGIVVNAGGIVAYYPTSIALHKRAAYLADGQDLFGDICRAAHEDKLAVFARMDSNRADESVYKAHPDWFAINSAGQPYRADDLYITCINGPYYSNHMVSILKEVAKRYKPEGFTDNSWSGLGRDSICYCDNCRKSFRKKTNLDIPTTKNWNDAGYRQWITWNYERRLAIWDLNNKVCKDAGGADCIWSGMNSGSISGQARSFRPFRDICRKAAIIMLDDQSRSDNTGFQHNGENGKLIHGMLGWDKLIPESMAMYQAHDPWFRLASKPEPEARMWMLEGMAGGIQPWWHMIAAYHEDRRLYHTPEKMLAWHRENEAWLLNRRPIATVAVLWSQQHVDFYGRDQPEERVELPWRGILQALMRARIPWLPVHIDDLDEQAASFTVLILPNLAAMSNTQAESIRRFVKKGGHLIATGETSLYNEWGDKRDDFALADLFGAHVDTTGDEQPPEKKLAVQGYHTYLRLLPQQRGRVDGPHKTDDPAAGEKRHSILEGFDETDTLPFGGLLSPLRVDAGVQVLATYIPQFPVYPPEKAWMRVHDTDIPALLLKESPGMGKVAFMPADLDRQYSRMNLPDHANLIRNLVNWAAGESIPLQVRGAGLVDAHLYKHNTQTGRLVLHLVNLTSAATWRQPLEELIAIGPLEIRIKLPNNTDSGAVRSLVSGQVIASAVADGWCHFTIGSILDHEVIVIG